MTANKIAARLLVIAGKRKKPKAKKKKKYNKAVENAFDDIQTHMDERTDYDQNTRAFRLLMRLKSALTAEGYRFNLTSPSGKVSPSLSSTRPCSVGLAHRQGHGHVSGLLVHAYLLKAT